MQAETPVADPITGEEILPPRTASMRDVDLPDSSVIESPLFPYGVGIDTHKRFIQVCILFNESDGTHRIEREFQTDYWSLCKARTYVEDNIYPRGLEQEGVPFRYTIESTGCYHLPVIQALGNRPAIINPVLAGPTRRKTDVLDARMLAQQSMLGLWRESYILSEQAETLRCLLAMRNEATRSASRLLNRINNHALRYGHTIGREGSMSHQRCRAMIEDMLEGRIPIADCISPKGIPLHARPIFKDSYSQYDAWIKVRDKFHKLTLEYVYDNNWPTGNGVTAGKLLLKCLMSVPSVGEVTALTWLSVVHDPRRFASPGQIAAYCGSDPSVKVSAGKTTSHTKRKGNARLHHALKNCAAQLVRNHKDPLGQWGYSILRRHRKASWGRAINAVARRLSIFLWHVHQRAEQFSYEKYRFYLAPIVPDIPIEDTNLHTRYKAMLADKGLTTTGEVARAFLTTLPQQKGIGPSCLNAVKDWIKENEIKPSALQQTPSGPQPATPLGASNPSAPPTEPPSSTPTPHSGKGSTKPNPPSSSKVKSSPASAARSNSATKRSKK